jgi:hypothetical protein
MESILDRILSSLSNTITEWFIKPSVGNSGGILVSINSSIFSILNVWIFDFLVSILLNTKVDNFSWLLTIVYGPVLSCKKTSFLSELRTIAQLGDDS